MSLLEILQEEAWITIELAKQSTERQLSFPDAENMINVAIGMRRSGKSYFLYQTINKLLKTGLSKEQILFINFEDDRLLPMNSKEMGMLIDDFYSLYPKNHQRTCYLFLDEVQNVTDWHLVVRRFFDSKNVQIYITGSSAKLLSKEINTSLRGRSLSLEVLPYSFQEYLSAHHIITDAPKPFGRAAFDIMQKHLISYFSVGGFPGVQEMQQAAWRETLQSYVDTVILKDIIERYNVSSINLLNYLTKTILKNTACIFSINKFYNDIKSQGFRVSKDTIHAYLNHLEDAFLTFSVSSYAQSERLKQTRPKKLYTIDNGLMNATSISSHKNYGHLLENLVYLDLRRKNKTVYYYNTTEGYEIDFVSIDPTGERELIQVTWDMSDEKTMQRELRALHSAEKELGIKGRLITAWDYLKSNI